jgi:Zn-dependent peptidase ImmA (M78 family)
MIPVKDALDYARAHFPDGPERLAEHLGIRIESSPLAGCDGWCLSSRGKAVIRISSTVAKSRQRFTLAHELAHLILNIPTVIGESILDILNPGTTEEQQVNRIAAEMLLPEDVVRSMVVELPVVAAVLRKLAKRARVSELAAALRVANLAEELGLINAAVVFFEDDGVKWQWSTTLSMPNSAAEAMLKAARKAAPGAFRQQRDTDHDVVIASLIENPHFATATMFVQLLPPEYGNRKPRSERVKELAKYLFEGSEAFQRQLQGCFGAFRPKAEAMTLEEAVSAFNQRYLARWTGIPRHKLTSKRGQEYIRLRLEEWCKSEESQP